MIITKSENLYVEMTAKLHAQNQTPSTSLSQLAADLEIIENNITRLHTMVNTIDFSSEEEEILFFKTIKPKFYSKKIYAVEEFNIISNVPLDTDQSIRAYYEREIAFLKRYFEQNQFLYQYFLNNQSSLDSDYFLRCKRQSILPALNLGDFETNGDFIIAKFLAYERLIRFLLERVRLTYKDADAAILRLHSKSNGYRWTDEKVKLVELAYGVYFMGSLNYGKADISEVVSLFEQIFNIDLGVAYRKFIDISRRKNKGYTVYLDAMRNAIHHHITERFRRA